MERSAWSDFQPAADDRGLTLEGISQRSSVVVWLQRLRQSEIARRECRVHPILAHHTLRHDTALEGGHRENLITPIS